MKKLILLLLIVPLSLFSQWSFSEKNDSFDGKYTAGYGIGHNGEFPYEYPRIVFRKKGDEIVMENPEGGFFNSDHRAVLTKFELKN